MSKKCKYYLDGYCYGQKYSPTTNCHGDIAECETIYAPEEEPQAYRIFRGNLRASLKSKVKDFIQIYIVDDEIIIEFYHTGMLSATYKESNISSKICQGISTDEFALKVAKWYKVIITNRYFY